MKVILEIDGWTKESEIDGNPMSMRGEVEIGFIPPPLLLHVEDQAMPSKLSNGLTVRFYYHGKRMRGLPIFSARR